MLFYKEGFVRPQIKGNVLDMGGGVGVFAAYLAHRKFETIIYYNWRRNNTFCSITAILLFTFFK